MIVLVLKNPAEMKIMLIPTKNSRKAEITVNRYFTWKLELISNILWMIVAEENNRNLTEQFILESKVIENTDNRRTTLKSSTTIRTTKTSDSKS